jgi:mannose-6-phosphate isomerase-like protein (cupin superfamily)
MLGVMPEDDTGFAVLERSGEERFQSLRTPLGLRAFGMNLIVLQPRQRGRIHVHEHQEEVYLVLEGELTLVVGGGEHRLGPDQVVRVGPSVRRQLVNAGSQRLVLLALGGAGEHQGRDARAFTTWDQEGPGAPPQEVPNPEDLPPA